MGLVRRAFILSVAALAGGVAVGWSRYRTPYPNPLGPGLAEGEHAFSPFVKIGADGVVTVIVPRAEMGQGVSTTLAALVAEELDQPVESLRVEHGPASAAYYNRAMVSGGVPFPAYDRSFVAESARAVAGVAGKFLGLQITGGSTSTIDAFDRMRIAGAAARNVLARAAAERLALAPDHLRFEVRAITDPQGAHRVGFGDVAGAAAALEPPGEVRLKSESEWRQLGRALARVDIPSKSRGEARFGIDVRPPRLLYATTRRNPRPGAGMRRYDPVSAMARPGVIDIVNLGDGFGVIAEDTWQAMEAARAVDVEWEIPGGAFSSDPSLSRVEAAFGEVPGDRHRDDGDVDAAFTAASNLIEARYQVPYLAHVCMEPMNATARVDARGCEIWVGTQAPTLVRDAVASALGIEAASVSVNTTLLGGGFGRRSEVDLPVEAARLASAVPGRPVQVTWSREEDIARDVYRPGAVAHMRGALDATGRPVALDARIAAQSPRDSFFARNVASMAPATADSQIVEGAHDQPYAIEHYRVTGHAVPLDVPVGFWRSVGYSANAFFHETFIDELALAAGVDPVRWRLQLMEPWPAAANVVRRVAALSGWERPLAPPRGRGLAFCLSFGSYVAQVVEVTDTARGIRIDRVFAVMDCGRVLDPGIVTAQIESGIVFGLSGAMMQEVTFDKGRARQSNFHDHDAMRIHQAPEIVVELAESAPRMGGAGEPGTPPSMPALGNAIFAATGKRLREMPFSRHVKFVG